MALHRRPDGRWHGGGPKPEARRFRVQEKRVPLALGKAFVALGSGEGDGQASRRLRQIGDVRGRRLEPRRRLRRRPAASCSEFATQDPMSDGSRA